MCEKLVVSELSISLSDVWERITHFLLTLYLSCSIIIIIIIIILLLLYHPLLLSGGGVLAHTILGVDFNDQTGDIR